jgi:hypothetical protein
MTAQASSAPANSPPAKNRRGSLGDNQRYGILDAVTAEYGSPTDAVDVLFGDGRGGGPRQILTGRFTRHRAGDIDGDGDLCRQRQLR